MSMRKNLGGHVPDATTDCDGKANDTIGFLVYASFQTTLTKRIGLAQVVLEANTVDTQITLTSRENAGLQ